MLKKIKKLATKDGEKFIDSTLVMDPAIKLVDSKFKTKFDTIMRAIVDRKMISFQYEDVMKKFGNDLLFRDQGKDRFSVSIKVTGMEGLYQWVGKYGANIKIESPKEDVDGFVEHLQNALNQYGEDKQK